LTGSKRKRFNSIEEHQKFVEDYKKKYKTEICKNFEFRGYCQWGDQVFFLLLAFCLSKLVFIRTRTARIENKNPHKLALQKQAMQTIF